MKRKYFVLILVLGFYSCQKESSKTDDTPGEVDVYVAGFVSDDDSPFDEHPAYWKNGSPVQLNFTHDYSGGARALSIAVSGNDVYVAGYEIYAGPRGFPQYEMFWKNGIAMDLEITSFHPHYPYEVSSLVVSNNDVYMVGPFSLWGDGEKATYYKNVSPVEISDGSAGSIATSIAVSGNDVYVAGVSVNSSIIINGSQNRIAKYWKNGNPVILTNGSKDAVTSSIAVSGTDVYVAGTQYDVQGMSNGIAEYWKNSNSVILTDGLTDAVANSIAVSGTDVYVAGREGNTGKYWKNGNPVNLTDGSKWAEAKSIAVSGNDVYVAGYEENDAGTQNWVAKYWKNGSPVILGDVSKVSGANSIFLAKK